MDESRIQAVEDVTLEAVPQHEAQLRWFYGELAGLDDVSAGAADGLLRFRSEQIELRIHLVDGANVESVAPRVVISVRSLSAAAAALHERRIAFQRLSGLDGTDRRLQVLDPAGNRVEFKQAWGLAAL